MSIEVLILAFEKAKKEIGSSKKTHLAQHLSDILLEDYNYVISERTLRDYYTSYKNGSQRTQEDLKPKLISCLCSYLGYDDYADYIQKNSSTGVKDGEENDNPTDVSEESETVSWTKIILISSVVILIVIVILYWPLNKEQGIANNGKCMAWADSLYVKVDCTSQPFSKFGTKVEPLDPARLKNLKKVEVNMASDFFTEDGKPMIWYSKNKDGEMEYFTAPGLHPITGETLKKITPYIIETYVPTHINRKGSFVQEE
ncbi:hypothetical protein [Flagellimonas pelagia]|uniref:Uncharacterized protein n=1 Tax=Flagellimonas pelagia TaxID=2306998 RepID=A0A3A1NNE6_9FLAO|nr:hypothetical protein [Allomuricauda maritima]RIV45612.1 hypothetical protein D2V05_06175 [Allomuricauda maritima]TXJ97438.1 hypothetical protein FQ017_06130 [Allomuricauda maritima]